MKARLFAVMLVAFALCSAASAQTYFIRAEGRNNLRSCAGFGCRVVETAPVGTVLEVVGEYNRWLKISRDGAEVWMANWIDYSRVEPGEPASSPPPSDVDNCCFVDRQCSSDEEWASGFWAFQNNQCAAPTASLPQTLSPPPASVDPSQIDNCCFLDWLCVTDDDWLSGFHAYQNNQCKHPGVAIEGSASFTAQIEAALDMLKDRAPQWYDYVISGLDKIKEDPESYCICVFVDTRTYVAPPTVVADHPDEVHILNLAGGLAHEACHVHRYEAGFPDGTDAEIVADERACLQAEIASRQTIDPIDHDGQWLRDLLENIENPEYWWWADD